MAKTEETKKATEPALKEAAVPAKPEKVMIADDSTFMKLILKNILTECGYTNIIEAENGLEAIDKFTVNKPDLVMMDIIMPDMGGIEALKTIIKSHPKAKVIMVTAVGQEVIAQECLDVGASDYINKPFKDQNVADIIKKVMAGAKRAKISPTGIKKDVESKITNIKKEVK